ncbi:MAG: class II fructose-bisphosphate aldolase [Candidatus Yanofskybacteria bacterium]|nr:class II fructose-bisphosphate aldolase [Candidatus Yanofskybacteria bacterium]
MNKKSLQYYYQKARKEGWALAQFNFSSAEQLKGIVEAAVALHSPLLLGTSEGDSGFVGMGQAVAMVQQYRRETKLPIFLNFDHGKSVESVRAAMEAGYDALHFDGSHLGFEENITVTKKIVRAARKKGITVIEGEFGEIPGKHSAYHRERTIEITPDQLTDPGQAKEFAKQTGVDSLAVVIGNVHGMYQENPRLDLARLQNIRKEVQCFLVLHGGSGTPERDLLSAIKIGIVKINISTELRGAFTQGLRSTLEKNPEEITPYKLFPEAVAATRKVAEQKISFFGSANRL